MDVKKRLTELVNDVLSYLPWGEISSRTASECADHLLANGVTVQEWISVEDRLPDEHETVLVWLGNNRHNDHRKSTDSVHEGGWWKFGAMVTHWSPWNMPEPPKEGS